MVLSSAMNDVRKANDVNSTMNLEEEKFFCASSIMTLAEAWYSTKCYCQGTTRTLVSSSGRAAGGSARSDCGTLH